MEACFIISANPFTHSASGKEVILKPNQQSILKNTTLKVADVNAEDAVSWKSGYFVFKATTLETVMKQVERWYNVEVVYKNEALKKRTFSGAASRYENVSIILKTIENTGEAKFNIEGRRVIVQE
ncbi:MAG: DUF4974 domain-containing protein [Flavobacterium sp.]|nr:MAG: DUF4974 domain-containing protein [Flavobacterium sp.]